MPDVVLVAIVGFAAAAVGLWAIPDGRGCPECPHCLAAREARARLQRELQHDLMHKGFGFRDDTPDRFVCVDEECPRNPR
jgi:fatty acid desaturase